MTFRVGQEVICINDRGLRFLHGEVTPVKGHKYTIREIGVGIDGVRLEEIVNSPRHYSDAYGEAAFRSDRFRPVVVTNIDVFTAMLAKPPVKKVKHEPA